MINIFTDGSSRGNPGPGGYGVIILSDDTANEIGGREESTTNNRMELTAVIKSLEFVTIQEEVTIHTDSAYVLNGATRWVKGWVKNKWKTSTKDDVLNRDLWERLLDLATHRNISWILVKGHSGHSGNERCDVIATSFADANPVILYNGSRQRYGVSISPSTKLSSMSDSGERKPKSKSKAYSYVSMVDGIIKTHKTWDECKKRVTGISGARYKKSFSPEDESYIISKLK